MMNTVVITGIQITIPLYLEILKKILTTICKAINATEYVLLKTLSFLYWESEQK